MVIKPPTPLRIARIADKGVHILRAVSEASDQTSAVDKVTTEPAPAETDATPTAGGGRIARLRGRFDDSVWLAVLGGIGVFIGAIALYTRFPFTGGLGRDESIYAYESQQFSRGHAIYTSIFDPKGPGAGMLGGIGAFIAHLFHASDLHGIRLMFLIMSVLTVVAIYLLVLQVFKSVPAAFAAGIAFTLFAKFAHDAIIGPDAKTPGVLLAVICMIFLARKQWFVGAIFAGLTFNCWQPFFWFALIAVIAAALDAEGAGGRARAALRALVGAAIPSVVLTIYFAIAGAFKPFISATFLYPLLGTVRAKESLREHLVRPFRVLAHYTMTEIVWWVGILSLLVVVAVEIVKRRRAALTEPIFLILFLAFVGNMLYAFYDFQSDPDTLALLPFGAIGVGAGVALLLSVLKQPVVRRASTGVVVIVAVVLSIVQANMYTNRWGSDHKLLVQLRSACGLDRVAGPGKYQLVSLGNPEVFVLTHRRSPTNYIYLASGVDKWKITHTKGGVKAWEREIIAHKPSVINVDGWQTGWTKPVTHFLATSGYQLRYIGVYKVYVSQAAIARAKQVNVQLATAKHQYARAVDGKRLPAKVPCGNG